MLIDRVLLLISARIDVMYSFVDCDRDTIMIEECHHLGKGNNSDRGSFFTIFYSE